MDTVVYHHVVYSQLVYRFLLIAQPRFRGLGLGLELRLGSRIRVRGLIRVRVLVSEL